MKNKLRFDGVYQTPQPGGMANLRFFHDEKVLYMATIEGSPINNIFEAMNQNNLNQNGLLWGQYKFDQNDQIVFTVTDKSSLQKLDFEGLISDKAIIFDVYSHINNELFFNDFYFKEVYSHNKDQVHYLSQKIMENSLKAYLDDHRIELIEMRAIKKVAEKYGLYVTNEETYPMLYYYASREVWGVKLPDLKINFSSIISPEQLHEWGLMNTRNHYTYAKFVEFIEEWHCQI